MRKLIAILVTLMLTVPCIAFAAPQTIDFDTMSYKELVELKSQIDKAIWASEDWQEVTVPQGVYEVGVDIPVGHWTIKAADGARVTVKYGDVLEASKKDISWDSTVYIYESVYSESRSSFDANEDKTQVDIEMAEKFYVIIDDGKAVFTPYSGKPDLGFK